MCNKRVMMTQRMLAPTGTVAASIMRKQALSVSKRRPALRLLENSRKP